MSRWGPLAVAAALVAFATAAPAQTTSFSPDVPTLPGTPGYLQPWEIWTHDPAGYGAVPRLVLPGNPPVDAIHKLDLAGGWLVSLAIPSDLAGTLAAPAEPRDVIRYDGAGGWSRFFCGGAVSDPVPAGANLDALYLDPLSGGDAGDLVVGFDIPVELPAGSGIFHGRNDLVRYTRTAPGCGGWTFAGSVFVGASAGSGIPPSSNVTGAAFVGGEILLVFDVPTVLTPTSTLPSTYVAGDIASWDGVTFNHYDHLTSWPASSRVDALAGMANPGTIPLSVGQLELGKSASPGMLDLTWPASCSDGASDYAVYEGTLGMFTSHTRKQCGTGGATAATLMPAPGDRYYLVVPRNATVEGSYGTDSSSVQRPRPAVPADRCTDVQIVTPCP